MIDFSKLPFDAIAKQMQNLPELMKQKQAEMRRQVVTGQAGYDELSVQVDLNGLGEMLDLRIQEKAYQTGLPVLQDLIKSAYQDARQKMDQNNKNLMPGLSNLGDLANLFNANKT